MLKLSLFSDDIIYNMENSNVLTPKLLGLINEFSKVAVYKISMHKSVVFYILIINYQKEKVKKKICLKSHKTNKIPRG